ncbi:hypothetical protein EYZ11_009353 [Aspergillus tanneri]|uniref:Uncharacterized protein n=1 Tax=Aspergillus tanneri TaxID=1220188 RepID=A0A4S3J8I7_9EURO|nr:hypothetical protein EYZ11_009353 [Aspergillus tanneri]
MAKNFSSLLQAKCSIESSFFLVVGGLFTNNEKLTVWAAPYAYSRVLKCFGSLLLWMPFENGAIIADPNYMASDWGPINLHHIC